MDEKVRIQKLTEVFYAIYHGRYGLQLIRQNQEYIGQAKPEDIIRITDQLIRNNIPMAPLKTAVNKFLNVVYKPLMALEPPAVAPGGLLDWCFRNNTGMGDLLKSARPLIKMINGGAATPEITGQLKDCFGGLAKMDRYYLIKENILFPLLEKSWKDHRCVKIMWSFHDDIRKEIRQMMELLNEPGFSLTAFNRLAGELFFHMNAIRFREERILFPVICRTIPEATVDALLPHCAKIGFPYYNPEMPEETEETSTNSLAGEIDLGTGILTPEQIMLIFNHLPVDITFIDENDQVRYYSTPPDRIFTRTKAVIGRDVRNCHPPESVHKVEKILSAFRRGERDSATFWIRMGEETVLIQYFACRDGQGHYKGVAEVSQVITSIQSLTGERRILDWKE
jgi:DUF438 domain-containing protein